MASAETYKLLELIIANIDCTIDITSITQIGSTTSYLISTHNTKWVGIGKYYTIDSDTYKVTDIVPNTSFTILVEASQDVPVATSMTIPAPSFHHGTFNMTAGERAAISSDTIRRNDFIYFNEPSTDVNYDDELDARDRDSNCMLFFMKETDVENWNNDQHYKYAVAAAGNLKNAFIQAAKNTSFVGELANNHTSENHVKWGVVGSQGHTKLIFDEHLSGKMVNITIPFLKQSCDFNAYNPPSTGNEVNMNFYLDGNLIQSEAVNSSEDITFNIIWQ